MLFEKWFPLLFPLFFGGLWCAVMTFLSRMGGWHRLAKSFRAGHPPLGRRFGMQSGKFGWVNYNNCLTIHVSSHGLHLAVLLPFRIGHPPLFIPWTAVRNPAVRRMLWLKFVVFDVESPAIAKLQLPAKVFDDLEVLQRT